MNFSTFIASIFWDPSREAFTVPYLNHPIAWYGLCFVIGFILAYYISIPLFNRSLRRIQSIGECDVLDWQSLLSQLKASSILLPAHLRELDPTKPHSKAIKQEIINAINTANINRDQLAVIYARGIATVKETSCFLVDRLCWFAIAGTIIGARLGHVFFYDWDRYKHDLWSILKTWEGGLASHGGAIGVLIALYLYKLYINRWYPTFSFLELLDNVCIPTALVGFFIRIGNFINQEILGTPTTLPWGVVFGHPADGTTPTPRHPVQLYEGLAYLAIFALLSYLWKKGETTQLKTGFLSGLCLTLLFSARFFLEFFKTHQDSFIETPYLQIGQYLSIPFILIGISLITFSNKK